MATLSSHRTLTALLAQKDKLELSQRIAELPAAGGSRHIYKPEQTVTVHKTRLSEQKDTVHSSSSSSSTSLLAREL